MGKGSCSIDVNVKLWVYSAVQEPQHSTSPAKRKACKSNYKSESKSKSKEGQWFAT